MTAKKVYVETLGCAANFADGEVIAGCLEEAGYEVTSNPVEAEILVYNTCAVKSSTENKTITLLKKVPSNKKLIVTGCLPLINFGRLGNEVRFDGAAGPSPALEIVKIVEKVERGDKVLMLRDDFKPNLCLPRLQTSNVRRTIPVSYGCLGSCSFCCVRLARGRLRSYSINEVFEYIQTVLKNGVKEVWLTAQDLASYGRDIGTNLIELLEKILKIEKKFFIRLGMMNPDNTLEILDGLIDVYKNQKMFKFLHLPIQSGDDEVLKLMNRHYTVEDFKKVVSTIRREIHRLTLSTDIICGFPNETEEDFKSSLKLIDEVKPDTTNVSKFYPRPNTPAEKMNFIPTMEVKRRSRKMSELTRKISLEKNLDWLSWTGEVIIDEKGWNHSWIGRNFAYKPVVVEGGDYYLGKYLYVRVEKAFTNYLKAEFFEDLTSKF